MARAMRFARPVDLARRLRMLGTVTDEHIEVAMEHGLTDDAPARSLDVLDKAMRRVRYGQDQLIELLHVAQDLYGYLPDVALAHLARELRLPRSHVLGVATFYHLFSFDESGEHTCTVCTGTACFVKGADAIVSGVGEAYHVAAGTTSEDGQLTLTTARCLGSCGLAPVAVVDGTLAGHQTEASVIARLAAVVNHARAEVGAAR